MKQIKFMPDYYCSPLWHDDRIEVGDIDLDSLPISTDLKLYINKWANEYDKTLNLEDPRNSGFKDLEELEKFKAEGLALSERLQKELGENFIIIYKPLGLGIRDSEELPCPKGK